jgi:hypothetical protein
VLQARRMAEEHDHDLTGFEWLAPWAPLPASQANERERQLERCLVPEHPLHGRPARALGERADDAPDTLFALQAPSEWCVVSLAGAGKRSATSPFFSAFESLAEFREACMLPDHLEHTDSDTD